jgi:hypothetical protein
MFTNDTDTSNMSFIQSMAHKLGLIEGQQAPDFDLHQFLEDVQISFPKFNTSNPPTMMLSFLTNNHIEKTHLMGKYNKTDSSIDFKWELDRLKVLYEKEEIKKLTRIDLTLKF